METTNPTAPFTKHRKLSPGTQWAQPSILRLLDLAASNQRHASCSETEEGGRRSLCPTFMTVYPDSPSVLFQVPMGSPRRQILRSQPSGSQPKAILTLSGVGGRDTTSFPARQGTAPHNKDASSLKVSCAKVKKPCSELPSTSYFPLPELRFSDLL